MELSGETALVTGAGGAIGAAVARSLAKQGAAVVLVDVDEAALARVKKTISGPVHTVSLDLSQPKAISAAIAGILSRYGRIDILVNNAGILSNNKMQATSLAEWHRTLAINLDAAFQLTQGFLPGMISRKWGRIVNMASYAAKSGGLTAGTAYSVSKSAIIGLTFTTARETAGYGITVNAIAPAYVMSPMVQDLLSETQRQDLLSEIPVGRFCEPEEVAHTVKFLVSPQAGFITGEVIDMNGGLYFD